MVPWWWSLSSSFFLFVYRTARLRRFLKNPTPRQCFIGISFRLLCIHFLLRWVCLSRPVFLFLFSKPGHKHARSVSERGIELFNVVKDRSICQKFGVGVSSNYLSVAKPPPLFCFVEGVGVGYGSGAGVDNYKSAMPHELYTHRMSAYRQKKRHHIVGVGTFHLKCHISYWFGDGQIGLPMLCTFLRDQKKNEWTVGTRNKTMHQKRWLQFVATDNGRFERAIGQGALLIRKILVISIAYQLRLGNAIWKLTWCLFVVAIIP